VTLNGQRFDGDGEKMEKMKKMERNESVFERMIERIREIHKLLIARKWIFLNVVERRLRAFPDHMFLPDFLAKKTQITQVCGLFVSLLSYHLQIELPARICSFYSSLRSDLLKHDCSDLSFVICDRSDQYPPPPNIF
jgi:hypothetical protein